MTKRKTKPLLAWGIYLLRGRRWEFTQAHIGYNQALAAKMNFGLFGIMVKIRKVYITEHSVRKEVNHG